MKIKVSKILIASSVFFYAMTASAYVFDQKNEKFGSYLRGSIGTFTGTQTPWSQSSGTGVSWDNQYGYLPSYEFGFLYYGGAVTWRLGFEVIQPGAISNANGKDSANGTSYYAVSSTLSAVNPKLGVEFNLKRWEKSRLWFLVEGGLSLITVQNTYSFTTAGTTRYGLSGFREEEKETSAVYAAGFGFETLMSDSTTISFEGGYRMADYPNLTQNSAVTNFQGPVAVGDVSKTNTGTNRDINLSGPFVSLDLRIWIF